MADEGKSFWTTLPGVLTGLAAVIAAVTGLYLALKPAPNVPVPSGGGTGTGTVTPTEPKPTFTTPTTRYATPPPPPPDTKMGPLQRGISYNQGDIYDRPATSAEECSRLCYNDNRCKAMTFIISQQRCWIKDRVNPTAQSSDMISAVRQ